MPPYNVPIAQGSPVKMGNGKIRSVADFGEAGVYPFADMIYELARPKDGRPGRLRAASVGFMPLEANFNEKRGGVDFLKQEGLEWSIVPIPSNREALQEAKQAGIDLAPMKEWAEMVLDSASGPGLWIKRAEVEGVYKALSEPRVVSAGVPIDKVVDAVLAFSKTGRVLSTANEARLRSARGSAEMLCEALDEVLAQVAADSEKAAAPAAPAAPPLLYIRPEPQPTLVITPEVAEASVDRAVKAALNRAAGRLD